MHIALRVSQTKTAPTHDVPPCLGNHSCAENAAVGPVRSSHGRRGDPHCFYRPPLLSFSLYWHAAALPRFWLPKHGDGSG